MKPAILPNFLKSQDTTCLSIYLPSLESTVSTNNRSYLMHVKSEVEELLRWSADTEKRKHFQDAIDRLYNNPDIAENQKYHVVIFLTEEGCWDFRFSGICRPFFSLANSFHIKPLIRYFHRNRKFFVLNFSDDQATLYVDGPERLRKLDEVVYPKGLMHPNTTKEDKLSFVHAVSDWLSLDLVNEKAPLLICGDETMAELFRNHSSYKGTQSEVVWPQQIRSLDLLLQICRRFITSLADQEEDTAIQQFQDSLPASLGSSDIELIAREAVKENVSLLIVAKDDHVWGEFNRMTGDVKIHYEQISDLDDDILDDIAEVCLANGVKVLVLEKHLMPGKASIAAIFHSKPVALLPNSINLEWRSGHPDLRVAASP